MLFPKIKTYFAPDRLITYLLYSLVVIVPLYYNTESSAIFTAPKLFALRVISLIILSLIAIKIFREGKLSLIRTPFHKYLFIFAGICVLNTVFSSFPLSSLYGNQGRFLGIFAFLNFFFIAFIAANFLKNKKEIITLIYISLFVATFTAIWGIFQSYGKLIPHEWNMDPAERVFTTFGHSNHFGAYLAFNLMLLIGLLFYYRKFRSKIILIIPGLIMLIALFKTASRGALFSFIGASFIFFFYCFLLKKYHVDLKKNLYKIIIIAIILIIPLGIFHQPIFAKIKNIKMVQRTIGTIDFMRQGNIPDRASWMLSSLEMIKDAPVLGHGLSTFKNIYDQYRRPDYRVPGEEQDVKNPESAHMEYLNIAVNQGLIGLAAYLLMIGFFIFALHKYFLKNNENRFLALGVLTAVCTYLIQVLLSFGEINSLMMLYLFLGAGIKLICLEEENTSYIFRIKYQPFISLLIAIFAVFGFYYSYRHYQVEKLYYLARVAVNDQRYDLAIDFYDRLVGMMPYEYEYLSAMDDAAFDGAVQEIEKGQSDKDVIRFFIDVSLKASQKAIEINPIYPELHGDLAVTYFLAQKIENQLGNVSQAEEYYSKAAKEYETTLKYSPYNPLYPYNLGKTFYLDADCQNAVPYFEEVLKRRDPYQDTYQILSDCYAKLGDGKKAEYYKTKK